MVHVKTEAQTHLSEATSLDPSEQQNQFENPAQAEMRLRIIYNAQLKNTQQVVPILKGYDYII